MTEQRWNPYDRGDARALDLLFRFLLNPNIEFVFRNGSTLTVIRPSPRAGFVEFVDLEWHRWSAGPRGPTVSVVYDANARMMYFARDTFRRRVPGDREWHVSDLDSEWVGANARAIELSFEREAR